ncbi:MurR/RpiR family transcriptional regulator [uncultured Catenibacterium sp.]|uniref:MurR/RpiR family transcriptional regulator n=1 Tax=uncultured Catenibacterium sp. TaxID=286142 RepID=UPI0025CFED2A|nr:MurR/RpiR family transcriptional regulator [uncultured Catenibacterium sp.]
MAFTYTQVNSLNETEAHIYNYVMQNKEKVLEESIRKLANDIHVSTATIVRFCKKLGCEGFMELKYKLKESITEGEYKNQIAVSSFVDFTEHIHSQKFVESIKRTADHIKNANYFYISFVGPYGDLAKFLARSFSHVGYRCNGIVDNYYPMPKLSSGESAVVIIGYNKLVDKAIFEEVKKYKEMKYTVVVVTAEDVGVLEHLCDEVIFTSDGFVMTDQVISNIPLIYTFEKIMRELSK